MWPSKLAVVVSPTCLREPDMNLTGLALFLLRTSAVFLSPCCEVIR